MPNRRRRGSNSNSNSNSNKGTTTTIWKQKSSSVSVPIPVPETVAAVENQLSGLNLTGNSNLQFGSVPVRDHNNQIPVRNQKDIWKPKSYGTVSDSVVVDSEKVEVNNSNGKGNAELSKLFENEKSDQEYAKCSTENQVLIGSARDFVRDEDSLAIIDGGRDEKGDLESQRETPATPTPTVTDRVPKNEGLIIFFPGIPGCAKSALCKEIQNIPGGLGDDRPIHSLMGDLVKGRYWPTLAEECRKKPYTITLADKNAPNEEAWRQIEDVCRSTRASAVPVIPDSEGTPSNPFSLDALAVFIFRVLQRVNHRVNLDKASPNAGYVVLMFYNFYEGKNRRQFESEFMERFGNVVKMPVVKPDSISLPITVKSILEEGLNLFKLHTRRHGRLDSTQGTYVREWAGWEKRLREVLLQNAGYLNSIQVPFDIAVKQVVEQLKAAAKGGFGTPSTEKRKFREVTRLQRW